MVTGGSRGIGRAIALRLATDGCEVCVVYLSSEAAARETAEAVESLGRRCVLMKGDVKDAAFARETVRTCCQSFGSLDVLVNNAGMVRDTYLTFMKEEDWDEVLAVNLTGAFHFMKWAAKEMVKQKWGRIISISSDAGLMGDVLRANYSAAKAGLLGLTKASARELAPRGVTVNAVAPGIISADRTVPLPEARRVHFEKAIPAGRFGSPEDVAALVSFLAGEATAYITGQVFCVDGGLYM